MNKLKNYEEMNVITKCYFYKNFSLFIPAQDPSLNVYRLVHNHLPEAPKLNTQPLGSYPYNSLSNQVS